MTLLASARFGSSQLGLDELGPGAWVLFTSAPQVYSFSDQRLPGCFILMMKWRDKRRQMALHHDSRSFKSTQTSVTSTHSLCSNASHMAKVKVSGTDYILLTGKPWQEKGGKEEWSTNSITYHR